MKGIAYFIAAYAIVFLMVFLAHRYSPTTAGKLGWDFWVYGFALLGTIAVTVFTTIGAVTRKLFSGQEIMISWIALFLLICFLVIV